MLIDFTVENFRSIKEPVTLSAIANPSREANHLENGAARRRIKPDNTIAPAFLVEGRGFELLPALGIFGANASGKSNVLKALNRLFSLIHVGIGNGNHFAPFLTPFNFDKTTSLEPTRFRLRQVRQNNIYTYLLTIGQDRVIEESLEYIPAASKRKKNNLLFSRDWDPKIGQYVWKNGDDFNGPHVQLEASLQQHEIFLMLLIKYLKVDAIEPLCDSIKNIWPSIGLEAEEQDYNLVLDLIGAHWPESMALVSDIVRRFDTGIDHLEIKKRLNNPSENGFDLFAWHQTPLGLTRLPFYEESVGTQRLFVLAYKIIDAFRFGYTMLVDELGSNIHPNITREIIRQFQSPKSNPKRTQLIFTSHDNTLQQRNLLRRDQIWFTAKRDDGSTELYPLTDFKPRNDLAIDKAYLDGRFGAVPILPDEEDLLAGLEVAR